MINDIKKFCFFFLFLNNKLSININYFMELSFMKFYYFIILFLSNCFNPMIE